MGQRCAMIAVVVASLSMACGSDGGVKAQSDCTAGTDCTPGNPCHFGKTTCSGKDTLCTDTTQALPDGTSCGTGLVCKAGSCSAATCAANQSCQPENACTLGITACASAVSDAICVVTGNKADGTSCGGQDVCSSGSCVPPTCTAGTVCQPANPCSTGQLSCSSATAPGTCTPTGTSPDGAPCGSGLVCSSGSCVAACAAGVSCQPTNPCAVGQTACASATAAPVCNSVGNKADGTACGTGLACSNGKCKVPVGTITYFPVPPNRLGDPATLNDIVAGPDGNLWFTVSGYLVSQAGAGKIGKMTLDGKVTETDNLALGNPYGITVGPDKAIWAAGYAGNTNPTGCQIYRMTADFNLTSYPLCQTYPQSTQAKYVTAGPDGNVWFVTTNAIGSISGSGSVVEYPLASPFGTPTSITTGPDDQVYFTTTAGMGRISMAGALTRLTYPVYPNYSDMAFAPDQSQWLTKSDAAIISHILPNGDVHHFAAPNATGTIAYGSDGNMWFTEPYSARIGRITPSGAVTEFETRTISSSITAGPDGNMWFTQTGYIGRITTK